MRIVLSDVGVSLEGWSNLTTSGYEAAALRAGPLDVLVARRDAIDELLIVACLERRDRSDAEALFGVVATSVAPQTVVTVIVPDAAAAFAALDAGDATDDELAEWFDAAYSGGAPWCAGIEDLARASSAAGFGAFEATDLPMGLPPGLRQWRRAVRIGHFGSTKVPEAPDARLQQRLRALARAGDVAKVATESAPVVATASVSRARELMERFLPRGGKRRALARAGLDTIHETQEYVDRVHNIATQSGLHEARTPSYRRWTKQHDVSSRQLGDQRVLSELARDPVTVHCIVLATGSWRDARSTLESVRHQSWSHWRATVVGRAPRWLQNDPRITCLHADGDDTASLVNQALIDRDERSLVLCLEAGDALAPDAFFRIADAVATDPLVDLVYWDDDVIERGERSNPRFRPWWSPETLLGANYLGRSFAMRRRRMLGLAGMREGLGDDAWHDLLLRADLTAEQVARIPRVLTHLRRRVDAPAARTVDVVSSHLARLGEPARAVATPGSVHLRWDLEDWPHVTVIIPTRHNREMVRQPLHGVASADYPSVDVIVVDNGGRTDERAEWYAESFPELDLEVEWWEDDFNYSSVNNAAARKARGDVLVFLNDDTEHPDPSWLRELVGWATRPDVGIAGLQLIGPDELIQHGGVILGLEGFADHLFQGLPPGSPSLLGPTTWYRNVLAVTGACLAIERNVFEELGGFDERFRLCGSDVVLGLDSVISGRRNVCSPFGGVRHLESATRGTYVPPEDYFTSYWRYQRWIFAGDPYFSPNLSLGSRVPRLRARYEQSASDRIAEPLGRQITVFRQSTDVAEVDPLARGCRITDAEHRLARLIGSADYRSYG
jgi:GT2 family glycosyltransferase